MPLALSSSIDGGPVVHPHRYFSLLRDAMQA